MGVKTAARRPKGAQIRPNESPETGAAECLIGRGFGGTALRVCGVVTVAVLPVPRDKTTSLSVSRGQMRSHSHSAMLMGLLCRNAPS